MNKGVHKLIILHARLTDAGDVTCRCVGQNETTAKLTVNKLQPPDGDAGDQETGDGKVRGRGKGNRQRFLIKIIYKIRELIRKNLKEETFMPKCFSFKEQWEKLIS